jgi:hypothetical protein
MDRDDSDLYGDDYESSDPDDGNDLLDSFLDYGASYKEKYGSSPWSGNNDDD